MDEVTEILSSLDVHDETQLLELVRHGSTPNIVLTALVRILDNYEDAVDCAHLYEFSQLAIERVFQLSATSSDQHSDQIKAMLYRACAMNIAENYAEIYDGFDEQFPFDTELPVQWRWPAINATPGNGDMNAAFLPFSALKLFGYTVGKSAGWPQEKRQRFLSDFMEMELPSIVSEHFGDEYGKPMSTTRLRKVANVLASNCSSRLRNNPSRYELAISDWIDDLDYLKIKYYEGHGLKFYPWPDTSA